MKKYQFLIATFIFLCALPNLGHSQITVIGYIRYGDNMPFRYRPTNEVEITSDMPGDTSKFYFQNLYPVEPTDTKPQTEIWFQMPQSLYDKKRKNIFKKVNINCKFKYPSTDKSKIDSCKLLLNVDLSDVIASIDKTYKLNKPIIILNAPERFTLTMMMNDIDDDLNSKEKDSGYQKTLKKLDKHFDDYYNSKKIDYNTMIDFYKLLVYSDYYVNDNSFFSREADKLHQRIIEINKEFSDTTNSNKNTLNEEKRDLLNELITSNEIYQSYQEIYGKLKDYNSRLKLILFLRTR